MSVRGRADQAGDADYAQAVRLFIAEEQNHARLLARLPAAGGVPASTGHWSDVAIVRLRRLIGLRMELLVLMIAEVVALRCYRPCAMASTTRSPRMWQGGFCPTSSATSRSAASDCTPPWRSCPAQCAAR